MRFLLLIAAFLIVSIIGFRTSLQNGSLMHYIDTHPDPQIMPPVAFFIAEGYYLFRNLQNSATYYQRISDQYPQSSYADDAYFSYLQSLDEMNTPRPQMAELYATYLQRFPQGKNADIVQKRIELCRNSR